MMKKRKCRKLFTYFLIYALVLNFSGVFSISSSAAGISYDGALAPSFENYEQILSTYDAQKVADKISQARAFSETFATSSETRAATKISIPGTFTIYQQETSYYCVPACVKSVIYYSSGILMSQDAIADDLGTTSSGTDFGVVFSYLNQKQNFLYLMETNPSQSTIFSLLRTTIAGQGKPAVMRIVNPTGRNWHYSTNGHALVINAVYSDNSKAQFADPLGGTQSGWPYYYTKEAAYVAQVCTHLVW